jgi:hypothetical protein
MGTALNTGMEVIHVVNSEEKSISLSTKVRNLLAFRLEGSKETARVGTHLVKKVEILEFSPTDEYAKQSIMRPAVQAYLKQVKYKKQIFMICGLKIAHGAVALDAIGKRYQGEGSLSLSLNLKGGTTLGTAKGSIGAAKIGTKIHDVLATHSFIFAYRLREVKYTRNLQQVYTREIGKLHELHGSSGSIPIAPLSGPKDQSGTDSIAIFECLSNCGADEFEDDSMIVEGYIMIGFLSDDETEFKGSDSAT